MSPTDESRSTSMILTAHCNGRASGAAAVVEDEAVAADVAGARGLKFARCTTEDEPNPIGSRIV